MKVQLESTTKIVTLVIDGQRVPARVWEGTSEAGVPIHAFITRVAVPNGLEESAYTQFEQELKAQRQPSPDVAHLPLSLIL